MRKIFLISGMIMLSILLTSCGEDKVNKKSEEVIKQEQSIKIAQEISDTTKEISNKIDEGTITEDEAQDMMFDSLNNSETVKSQLELQKKQMPKLLKLMTIQKVCLEKSDTKDDVLKCLKNAKEGAKEMGIAEMYTGDENDEEFNKMEWNKAEKEKTLKEMEEGLSEMTKMMPCLENAKVMTDMMKCYDQQ